MLIARTSHASNWARQLFAQECLTSFLAWFPGDGHWKLLSAWVSACGHCRTPPLSSTLSSQASAPLVLGSWLSAQMWPSNWSLWLSAQDFREATGHSSCPHKSHPQLDTPAPLILRRVDNKVHKSSQQLDTPWPSSAKAEANPGYPH